MDEEKAPPAHSARPDTSPQPISPNGGHPAGHDAAAPPCLYVRLGDSVGLPQRRQRRHAAAQVHWETLPYLAGSLSALIVSAIAGVAGLTPLVWLSGLVLAALGVFCAAAGLAKSLRLLSPADTLEDLARAVFEALCAADGVAAAPSRPELRVESQGNGCYRCYLVAASAEEEAVFTTALAEVLSPPPNPRFALPRYMARAPHSLWQALGELMRGIIPGHPGAPIAYHAMPAYFAEDQQRLRTFQRAWNRYVSPGRLVPGQHPRAQAALARQRYAHSFAVTLGTHR